VRAAVFELRDAALRVALGDPILVADPLVFPLLIVAANLFVRRFVIGFDDAVLA
jgi:hypothetical protein